MAIESRLLGMALIAVLVVLLPAEAPGRAQESAAVMQLRQEIGNLRFRLDYETNRMQRLIDGLQRQVRQNDPRPIPSVPLPVRAPEPAPSTVGSGVGQRLRIEDDAGRPRAALTVSERFGPMMALMGGSGDVEAMLSVPAAGPRLELFDRAGRTRIVLGLEEGKPELRLLGEDGAIVDRLGARSPSDE